MKLTLAIVVLLAATATAQTKQGCKASFYFIYTDTLKNEYAGVQGKELHEIAQRLRKKQHNEICLADIQDKNSEADYVFHVVAETRKRLWQGSEVFYTNYSLEVEAGTDGRVLHTFARVPAARAYTAFYTHQPSENKVIIGLVEEAADWLDVYIKHGVAGASPVPASEGTPASGTPESKTNTKPKHYDHGTDESSFGLVAHVKATEQRASQCISTVDIGNSEVEVYNFEHPASCLGFSNLSAGMNFKARFSLICEGNFDACTMENVEGAQAGILIYLPPAVTGADAIIQEYKIVGTREIPNAPKTDSR